MKCALMALAVVHAILERSAYADVIQFDDRTAWETAAGQYTTISFVGFPANTIITTQYAQQGVTFTDGIDLVLTGSNIFPNDGFGLNGAFATIAVSFSQPMSSIAVDFPGFVRFRLYDGEELLFENVTSFGIGGVGNFGGLVSGRPFDSAVIFDATDGFVFIDDLHFGPPIPAPAVGALFAAPWLVSRRRRA